MICVRSRWLTGSPPSPSIPLPPSRWARDNPLDHPPLPRSLSHPPGGRGTIHWITPLSLDPSPTLQVGEGRPLPSAHWCCRQLPPPRLLRNGLRRRGDSISPFRPSPADPGDCDIFSPQAERSAWLSTALGPSRGRGEPRRSVPRRSLRMGSGPGGERWRASWTASARAIARQPGPTRAMPRRALSSHPSSSCAVPEPSPPGPLRQALSRSAPRNTRDS